MYVFLHFRAKEDVLSPSVDYARVNVHGESKDERLMFTASKRNVYVSELYLVALSFHYTR